MEKLVGYSDKSSQRREPPAIHNYAQHFREVILTDSADRYYPECRLCNKGDAGALTQLGQDFMNYLRRFTA